MRYMKHLAWFVLALGTLWMLAAICRGATVEAPDYALWQYLDAGLKPYGCSVSSHGCDGESMQIKEIVVSLSTDAQGPDRQGVIKIVERLMTRVHGLDRVKVRVQTIDEASKDLNIFIKAYQWDITLLKDEHKQLPKVYHAIPAKPPVDDVAAIVKAQGWYVPPQTPDYDKLEDLIQLLRNGFRASQDRLLCDYIGLAGETHNGKPVILVRLSCCSGSLPADKLEARLVALLPYLGGWPKYEVRIETLEEAVARQQVWVDTYTTALKRLQQNNHVSQ